MKLTKCLKHAFSMVVHSQLRSWLTILGIVIGVASVISIVSLGNGMEASINSQMGDLGGDIVTISAGYSKGGEKFGPGRMKSGASSGATEDEVVVDRSDYQVLRGISDISIIDRNIRDNVDVTYLGKTGSVSLTGVDQKVWSQVTTKEISTGRLLDSADQNVIVIGGKLAEDYFDQVVGINKMISIEGSSFRVVGVLDDTTTSIYMPLSMAYQILTDKDVDVYDSIVIKVKDEDYLDETIEKVESKLMMSRHVNEKTRDFSVNSNAQTNEMRAEMMSSMSLFLTAIAGVSLLVGAVGIANTMFTSVLEKTKEIGIMKAIGARNRDILLIFLFNAGLIGLVGGLLGVLFGVIVSSSLMPILLTDLPMGKFGAGGIITFDTIFISLGVSVAVGMIAGMVPAFQASKLKPVDALRGGQS